MDAWVDQPKWWRAEGARVVMQSSDWSTLTLSMSNGMAELIIGPAHEMEGWVVSWYVKRSKLGYDCGAREFSSESLAAAFGLSDTLKPEYDELARAFGATTLKPNTFIRRGDYVCLPGPIATGDIGYQCWISLELDEHMRRDIEVLLMMCPNGGVSSPSA